MRRKKAAFLLSQQPFYVFFTFFILAFALFIMVWAVDAQKIDPEHIEEITIDNHFRQLINNPNCFAYQQPSGRIDQYVIDLNKATNTTLQLCMTRPVDEVISAKATIRYDDKEIKLETTTWSGSHSYTKTRGTTITVQTPQGKKQGEIILQLNV